MEQRGSDGREEGRMERDANRRSGVAVIIVLGLMALLMVLGIAFSVTMRVERAGAGNYALEVYQKQMVYAGLARAIAELNEDLGTDVYPDWDFDVSGTGGVVNLVYGEAEDYVPGVLLGNPSAMMAAWTNLGGRGTIAYQIFNCSDMLDANYVGDVDRGGGTNVSEIQVGQLPSVTDLTAFREDRTADVRYESIRELGALNGGITNDADFAFVTFSRYPTNEHMVSLAGSSDDLKKTARRSKIVSELGSAVSPGHAAFIFNSLIDYIDTNSIPHDGELNFPYVERVPMVNEMRIKRFVVRRTPSTCNLTRREFAVELAFPFVEESSHAFDVQVDVATTITDNSDDSQLWTSSMTFVTNTVAGSTAQDYSVVELGLLDEVVPNISNTVAVTVSVEMRCQVLLGADVVDATPWPYTDAGLVFSADAGVINNYQFNMPSYECVDPRFNWDATITNPRLDHWILCPTADGHTMDNLNQATRDFWVDVNHSRQNGFDTSLQMRISDNGSLRSVAELGALLRDYRGLGRDERDPRFKTIRLYDTGDMDRDEVLDSFTVQTAVRRGVVNVNSIIPGLISAAFFDAPLRYPPAVPDPGTGLSASISDAIEDQIVDGGPYTNVAEICNFDWSTIPGLGVADYTELERESILAHTWELLGTRQNLFVIIVAEGAPAGGVGRLATGEILVGRRAVAVVWRDPFPTEDPVGSGVFRHKCFVQFFKWLDG
jgi:hypothetical protein